MQIIHRVDDFLFTIFPEVDMNDKASMIKALENYYSYAGHKPTVTIEGGVVFIDIDSEGILSQEADFKKAIALCKRENFDLAKPLLKKLIEQNPTNSEYHRNLGQICSQEGDQEEAINYLIDALRWNPTNSWALTMMGNIFSRYKNDTETAMKYYDQAALANPTDAIALNNIAGVFLQQEKIQEAKKYFDKALKLNDKYPNTYYGKGLIAEIENDLYTAFSLTIKGTKLNKTRDVLYENSVRQAVSTAQKIIQTEDGKAIYLKYRAELEEADDKKINIIPDETIATAAKTELAENHNRDNHIIKYKPQYLAVEHLIMHELVHIDFRIAAEKENLNQLFVTTQNERKAFVATIQPAVVKLKKLGFAEDQIEQYCTNVFTGITAQVFNTPIDLFIEDFIYDTSFDLRPFQFLSLYNLYRGSCFRDTIFWRIIM